MATTHFTPNMDELKRLKKELQDLVSKLQGTGSRDSLAASSRMKQITSRIQELESQQAAGTLKPGVLPTSDESD